MVAICRHNRQPTQWIPPKATVRSRIEVSSLVGPFARMLSGSPGGARRIKCFGLESAVNNGASRVNETKIVVAGVMAKAGEGLVHIQSGPLRHHTFGLLYDDATVERMIELLVHELGLGGGPVVNDGDGGDIGQGLGGEDVSLLHGPFVSSEKAQGTDGLAP
jgi:hypothetical protein